MSVESLSNSSDGDLGEGLIELLGRIALIPQVKDQSKKINSRKHKNRQL